MQKSYQAVIFDLDGTLYDNRHLPIQLVLSNPLKAFWMLSERMARRRLAGKEFDSSQALYDTLYHTIANKHYSTPHKAQRWYEESYMPTMVRLIGERHPIREEIVPLIEHYRNRGMKIALFSDYAWTHDKLSVLGIDESLFDIITDGLSLAGLKPCKRSFMRVLELLHSTADTTLMIGDRDDTDGAGAKSVGMDFINIKKLKDLSELWYN